MAQGRDATSASAPAAGDDGAERIAKRIARAGLCSRREAERLVLEGRVRVDNRPIAGPALDVRPDQLVTVDGRPLPEAGPARLFRYHKPRGVITTASDPEGRPTVYDNLPPDLPRVMPIGRLDINSEGLLLLTNDGGLKRRLELPATGWIRRYKARAFGRVDPAALEALRRGITVEGVAYGPIEAHLDASGRGDNVWLTVALREGKNREVRRALEHIGLRVSRLIRLAYGPFQLGALPRRAVEEVPGRVLADQLGGRAGGGRAGAPAAAPRGRRRGPAPAPAGPARAAG